MMFFSKILQLFFAILALSAQVVTAQDRVSVMVFDASGSMWAELSGGKTKIEIARDVVGEYLINRTASVPLAVIAYGHNRKGDCSDIEVLAPMGVQDGQSIAAQLRGINPKGKTPLTDALELAVRQIPKTAEEADVILITDGLETCGRDPCALAREIAASGITIRAHIVGFGLTEVEADALACIAEETGGQLLRPQNGADLAEALIRTTAAVVTPTPEPTPPQTVPLRITIDRVAGTARPAWVTLTATNLDTGEVIELDTRTDTAAIMGSWSFDLGVGNWRFDMKGPIGSGNLEVALLGDEVQIAIPFAVPRRHFTLADHGPYELGISQSFLLNSLTPVQRNMEFTVALVPMGATETSQRLDWETRIGSKGAGVTLHDFRSPDTAGDYEILVLTGYKITPDRVVARFPITYAAGVIPQWTGPRQGDAGGWLKFSLTGNLYRNNGLILTATDGTKYKHRLANIFGDAPKGLQLPDVKGIYALSLDYKNAAGERIFLPLGDVIVGVMPPAPGEPDATDTEMATPDYVFTCADPVCTYTHIAPDQPDLVDIPLRQGWSLSEPYFYQTAADTGPIDPEIHKPTLEFFHPESGDRITLNMIRGGDALPNCLEFGDFGHHAEAPVENPETLCFPDGSDNIANTGTLIEEIEYWRSSARLQLSLGTE